MRRPLLLSTLVLMIALGSAAVVAEDKPAADIKPGDWVEVTSKDCAKLCRGFVTEIGTATIAIQTKLGQDKAVIEFERTNVTVRLIEAPPEQAPEKDKSGWHGEKMPEGMRKAEEKNVYLWSAPEGLEIQMVYVPPGDFVMGSDDGDDDEKPRHKRAMPWGYYVGRYETTWKEYRAFCRATGRATPTTPRWGGKDDHPVVNVSWDDTKAFCDWAGLSLPSEAQWEKAARGTDGRQFPWGNDWNPQLLNFNDSSCTDGHDWQDTSADDGYGYTAPVGSYVAGKSPFGAHDMAGNVWEWCADWYDENAHERYAKGQTNPPAQGELRVLRSGGWDSHAVLCRCALRSRFPPPNQCDFLGFRPVKNLD
ncbi:formylglycine-generating enzyme family protein [Planctomycetota bacterium]